MLWLNCAPQGETDKASACNDQVVRIWSAALNAVVLGIDPQQPHNDPASDSDGNDNGQGGYPQRPTRVLPVGRLQLMEVVDILLDIARTRGSLLGPGDPLVGDAHFAAALALLQLQERARAGEELNAAAATLAAADGDRGRLLQLARIMLGALDQ